MKAYFEQIEIHKISFETGDKNVLVDAKIKKGNLSFETELIISFSDLNCLINQLHKVVNYDIDFSSMFETEKMYDGNLLYTLDLTEKFDSKISIDVLEFNHEIRQIRA